MLRRIVRSAILGGMIGLMGGGGVIAGSTTTTFPVAMVVDTTCSVQASGINFGILSTQAPTTATGTITVTCQAGTAYSIALDHGTNTVPNVRAAQFTAANGQTHLIPYELHKDPTRAQVWGDQGLGDTHPIGTPVVGTGTGLPQTTTVYGVASPDLVAPPVAGTYVDTVLVTVSF